MAIPSEEPCGWLHADEHIYPAILILKYFNGVILAFATLVPLQRSVQKTACIFLLRPQL